MAKFLQHNGCTSPVRHDDSGDNEILANIIVAIECEATCFIGIDECFSHTLSYQSEKKGKAQNPMYNTEILELGEYYNKTSLMFFPISPSVHHMSRHTSPNKKRVDDAFPVRLKIKIPPNGLGNLSSTIQVWINENLGTERCSVQSTRGIYCQATAYYFRSLLDAQAFLSAFPNLELADGVETSGLIR